MKKLLTLLAGSSLAFYMQACSDNSTSADDDPLKPGSVYVFGSDMKSGELRSVAEDGISEKAFEFYQDSKIRGIDGNLFILERYGKDNLVLFDVSEGKTKWQNDLDDAANPSDVVKANKDEVWVSLEGAPELLKVSIKDGKVTKTIKTDKFIQGKALSPSLADLEVSGDTLFALFQRGDENWSYPAPGLLAMYKLDNGDLLDTIQLVNKNPMGMGFAKGKLYVGSQGNYVDSYGVEVVDLAKKKSSEFIAASKFDAGLFSFVVDPEGVAYAAVLKKYGEDVPLVKIDLSEKTVKTISGVKVAAGSLVFDDVDGVLYIGDRDSKNGGLYKYDGDKLSKVDSPKEMLPVYGIAVVR